MITFSTFFGEGKETKVNYTALFYKHYGNEFEYCQ